MKTQEVLESYHQFVKKQKEENEITRLSIMTLLLETITNEMGEFGWVKKGKGSVTDSMVKTGICKFNFVKEYHGEKVVSILSVNINDIYSPRYYSQMKVNGSKEIVRSVFPLNVNQRWSQNWCSPEFDLTYTNRSSFFLSNLLRDIDNTYL